MLVAASDDEQMAILDAWYELHAVVAELLIKIIDEHGAVFR